MGRPFSKADKGPAQIPQHRAMWWQACLAKVHWLQNLIKPDLTSPKPFWKREPFNLLGTPLLNLNHLSLMPTQTRCHCRETDRVAPIQTMCNCAQMPGMGTSHHFFILMSSVAQKKPTYTCTVRRKSWSMIWEPTQSPCTTKDPYRHKILTNPLFFK